MFVMIKEWSASENANLRQGSSDGVILQTTKGQMKVQVCNTRIIRVVYTLNDDFSKGRESDGCSGRDFAPVLWNLEETDQFIEIATEELHLEDQ